MSFKRLGVYEHFAENIDVPLCSTVGLNILFAMLLVKVGGQKKLVFSRRRLHHNQTFLKGAVPGGILNFWSLCASQYIGDLTDCLICVNHGEATT